MLNCSVLRGLPAGFGARRARSRPASFDQLRGLFEIRLRFRELTDADVAMAAMAVELRVVGIHRDALRGRRDGVDEPSFC